MKKNVKSYLKIIVLFFILMILVLNVNSLAEYENTSNKNVQELVGEYENTSDVNLDLVKNENVLSNEVDITSSEKPMLISSNEDSEEPLLISEKDDSFEYQGTVEPTVTLSEQQVRNINFIYTCYVAVLIFVILLFLYFIGKLFNYFKVYNEYKKAVAEGKEVEKPEIKIKIKYIILLVIILDVVVFGLIYAMNLNL